MIKLVYAADLFRRPVLAASMFRDRAVQFRDRLKWDVNVDAWGHEFDQYDDLNPIYVVLEDEQGQHLGSARLLPTTGRTMTAEHFSDLTGGVAVQSPLIWETTRFCLSPRAQTGRLAVRGPSTIMWAGCELALRSGIEFYLGVFNAQMLRVYKSTGWCPEVLGTRSTAEGEICVGLWEVTPQIRDNLRDRAGIGGAAPTVEYFPTESRFPAPKAPSRKDTFAAAAEIARFL